MFEHCLYFNTTALARQLERAWGQAFKPFGLTPPQAFMLRVILAKPGLSATELAQALQISKATCSRTFEGLLGSGWVQREQAASDARFFSLQPTEKARAIHDQINLASAQLTEKLKAALGDEVFQSAVSRMRGIRSHLD